MKRLMTTKSQRQPLAVLTMMKGLMEWKRWMIDIPIEGHLNSTCFKSLWNETFKVVD
jgi:hypothetical protein